MNWVYRGIFLMAGLLSGASNAMAQNLWAQGHLVPKQRSEGLDRRELISSYEAMRRAEKETGGKALSAQLMNQASGPAYRVKVFRNGSVQFVTISARP